MLEGLIQSTTVPLLEQAVNFAQARHNLLAGNIANLDTPGYQARDLSVEDFQERLREAIALRHGRPMVSPGETAMQASKRLAEAAQASKAIVRHDGSNVGLEQQVTEMVKNQMQHNLALAIMRSQFQLLQVAISERV